MPITMFRLLGTDWEAECRNGPQDIVIWKGGVIKTIIFGDTANERLEKAKAWFRENVPGYNDDDMVRIQ